MSAESREWYAWLVGVAVGVGAALAWPKVVHLNDRLWAPPTVSGHLGDSTVEHVGGSPDPGLTVNEYGHRYDVDGNAYEVECPRGTEIGGVLGGGWFACTTGDQALPPTYVRLVCPIGLGTFTTSVGVRCCSHLTGCPR